MPCDPILFRPQLFQWDTEQSLDGYKCAGSIYLMINAMADAVFYFLLILIGFNAAKRIEGNPLLTAVVGGVIIHPTVLEAANNGLDILNLGDFNFPFVAYTYSIFPMILAAWLVKKIELWLKKWVPLQNR